MNDVNLEALPLLFQVSHEAAACLVVRVADAAGSQESIELIFQAANPSYSSFFEKWSCKMLVRINFWINLSEFLVLKWIEMLFITEFDPP